MKRLLPALLILLLPAAALGQSSPGLVYGQVPTAGQWNGYFAAKQDVLPYVSVNRAGDTMQGPLGVPQIVGSSGIPNVGAGAGAGTGPTVGLLLAHDTAFNLTVTTGSSAGASATIVTVTFSAAWVHAPHCVFSPTNDNAAGGSGGSAKVHETSSATTWTLVSSGTALTDATTYTWSVICFG